MGISRSMCIHEIGFKNKFLQIFIQKRKGIVCVGHISNHNHSVHFVTDLIRPDEEISALNGDDEDFDDIKRLCDESTIKLVRLRPSDVCNHRLFYNNNNEVHRTNYPSSAVELNTMSVVSLYDQDYAKEMSCDE